MVRVSRALEVVAVEPSSGMRREARERHPDPRIRWLEDSLPSLAQTHRLGLEFDFIFANAVWMHVRPEDRKRAFRKLATLLAPSGRIVISLRLGTPDPDRVMYLWPPIRNCVDSAGLNLLFLRVAFSSDDRL